MSGILRSALGRVPCYDDGLTFAAHYAPYPWSGHGRRPRPGRRVQDGDCERCVPSRCRAGQACHEAGSWALAPSLVQNAYLA